MTHNRFFASDHHFDHANILNFVHHDGSRLRDFVSVEEMNETMIERHNAVVKPHDKVYFLGDVAIPRRGLQHVKRLNGKKRLIMGNHDPFKNKDYYDAGFEVLSAFRKFDRFVATHIPVHPDSISQRWFRNVHGHTHRNIITKIENQPIPGPLIGYRDVVVPDERYINVSVEQIDYTPISLEEINARIDATAGG